MIRGWGKGAGRVRGGQGGFTLIEVLAAFVILSIGLLGIVSLQALSKVSQHQAMQRTKAVTLADDMLERIRINPIGLPTYAAGGVLGNSSISSEPSPNCSSAACTPVQLASHDLWVWERALDGTAETVTEGGNTRATGGLVAPRGCISFSADTGKTSTGVVDVIIQWQGLEETSDALQAGDTVCGGAAIGSDNRRRQVVVSSYVIDEGEL